MKEQLELFDSQYYGFGINREDLKEKINIKILENTRGNFWDKTLFRYNL